MLPDHHRIESVNQAIHVVPHLGSGHVDPSPVLEQRPRHPQVAVLRRGQECELPSVVLGVDVNAVRVGVDEGADDLVPAHSARGQQERGLVCVGRTRFVLLV